MQRPVVPSRRVINLLIRDHSTVDAKLLIKTIQIMAPCMRNASDQLVKPLCKWQTEQEQ